MGRAGFAVGSQGTRNEAVLRRFLLKSGVGVLHADEQTTHHYAVVYLQLGKQGTPNSDERYVDRSSRPATRVVPGLTESVKWGNGCRVMGNVARRLRLLGSGLGPACLLPRPRLEGKG